MNLSGGGGCRSSDGFCARGGRHPEPAAAIQAKDQRCAHRPSPLHKASTTRSFGCWTTSSAKWPNPSLATLVGCLTHHRFQRLGFAAGTTHHAPISHTDADTRSAFKRRRAARDHHAQVCDPRRRDVPASTLPFRANPKGSDTGRTERRRAKATRNIQHGQVKWRAHPAQGRG